MSMMLTRQTILFVEDPTLVKANELVNALCEHDDEQFVYAALMLCCHRMILFSPDLIPAFIELAEKHCTYLLLQANMDYLQALSVYFPEHIINPDKKVRRELTRKWFNECRSDSIELQEKLPRWKSEEEMLNE